LNLPDAAATVQPPQEVRKKILQLTPTIAVHLSLALSAVAIGPLVLWARLGAITRPQLHRALGYAWVTCMLGAALTGVFIHDIRLPNEVTQAQLMLLQSQLEPHMLFNTLAHLRALIGQDTARAHAMLDHLNDYLRTTLQATRLPMHQALHPLGDEFSRLGDYLSLMAIRMGPRMSFELDLPPALATASVPRFILQPLVENAIRHGLEPQVSGGRIEVQARAEGAQLLLTVRDNGLGISELALADAARPLQADGTQAGPSWGLSHVRQRLHTLYGERAGMHISPVASGGTCVVLTLPFNNPHDKA
jgi:sensor histidine kinase YesM